MDHLRLASHVYAIRATGFTRLAAQVTGAWLDELRDAADRSLAAAVEVYKAKGALRHVASGEGYEASRCLYCWGESVVRLMDLESIHAVAAQVLGSYKLWDLSALSVTPIRTEIPSPAGTFHRDKAMIDPRVAKPPFLWCFLCLDDTTAKNGATWVVPGSHLVQAPRYDALVDHQAFCASIAQQACALAGDIIFLDPTMLHAAGQNRTSKPRRLINVGLCSAGTSPLLDHRAIAGTAIQSRLSERVLAMMQSDEPGLEKMWDALPKGWEQGR